MADTISIKVRFATKDRIEAFKVHPRETFDDVISRLLDHAESHDVVGGPALNMLSGKLDAELGAQTKRALGKRQAVKAS